MANHGSRESLHYANDTQIEIRDLEYNAGEFWLVNNSTSVLQSLHRLVVVFVDKIRCSERFKRQGHNLRGQGQKSQNIMDRIDLLAKSCLIASANPTKPTYPVTPAVRAIQ